MQVCHCALQGTKGHVGLEMACWSVSKACVDSPSGTWADLANMLTGCFCPELVQSSRLDPFSALVMPGAFWGLGAFWGCLRMRGCVSTIMNALLVIASRDRTPTTRQGGRNGLQQECPQTSPNSSYTLKPSGLMHGPCRERQIPHVLSRKVIVG